MKKEYKLPLQIVIWTDVSVTSDSLSNAVHNDVHESDLISDLEKCLKNHNPFSLDYDLDHDDARECYPGEQLGDFSSSEDL